MAEEKIVYNLEVKTKNSQKSISDLKKENLGLLKQYVKEAENLVKLKKEYKEVVSAQGKNSKQAKKLANNIKKLDTRLRKINVSVNKFQKNLGKSGKAFKNLGGILAAGGVTLGVVGFFNVIKNGIKIIKDFDQAQADLGAISGKSAKKLKPLQDQALKLGASTQFSATEITKLQIELAKLGFETDQITQSTGGIANFAAATGVEIPRAAALAGSSLRAFGLDASEMDRVVSVLGVATTKTALDFSKLEAGLSTVAPVAKAFGFSIEDTTALLGQLANSGFDASSSATATRNILLNLADANGKLAQSLGRPITSADDLAEGLKELQGKGVDLATALELTDKRSVAAFQTFLDGSGSLVGLRDSITDVNDELTEMAEKRLQTLDGSLKLLSSAWEGFILKMNEGSGVSKILRKSIKFLADNLETLFKLIATGAAAFAAYKTTILAANLATKLYAASQKVSAVLTALFTKRTKQATVATKLFNKATKNNVLAILITLITTAIGLFSTYKSTVDDVAESQKELNKEQELYNQLMSDNKTIEERIDILNTLNKSQTETLSKSIDTQLTLTKELRAELLIAARERNKSSKEIIKINEEIVKSQELLAKATTDQEKITAGARLNGLKVQKSRIQEELIADLTAKDESRKAEIVKLKEFQRLAQQRLSTFKDSVKEEEPLLKILQKKLKENVELREKEVTLGKDSKRFENLTKEANILNKQIKILQEKLKLEKDGDDSIKSKIKNIEITRDLEILEAQRTIGDKEKLKNRILEIEIDSLSDIIKVREDEAYANADADGKISDAALLEINKLKKLKTDAIKKIEDNITKNTLEGLETTRDLALLAAEKTISDEEELAREKLRIQQEYLDDLIKLYEKEAKADGKLTDTEKLHIEELKKARRDSAKEQESLDEETKAKRTEKLIGQIEEAIEISNQLLAIWGQVNDILNAASERRIEQTNTQHEEDVLAAEAASSEKTAILLEGVESQSERDQIKVEQQELLDTKLFNIEKAKNDKIEAEKKKQFKRDKAFNLAQAVISTATAVVKALNTSPFLPLGPIMAGIAAASGAVQIGTIASQKYAEGGLLIGNSHSAGGIDLGGNREGEGGEFIVRKTMTQKHFPLIDAINNDNIQTSSGNPLESKEFDYERLAALINDKEVVIVSSKMTEQQNKDVKIQNSVRF